VGGLVVLGSEMTCWRRKGEEADRLVISGEGADCVGARKVEDRRLVLELVDSEHDCATTVRRWSRGATARAPRIRDPETTTR
jgi:RES domain-containing protein